MNSFKYRRLFWRPQILHRQIWRECWEIFAVSLVVITFIVFMGRITRVMQMIITRGVNPADIGYFCLLLLPYLLFYTVPMAAMLAVLATFLRMSHDHEIMALKTSGVGVGQLLPPVLVFGVVTTGMALFFSLVATPWSNQEMRQLLVEITKRRADLGIREQVFNNDFAKVVLFVNRVPPGGGLLQGIFLADERDPALPMVITADQARLVFDPQNSRLVLQLFRGRVIHLDEAKNAFYSVEFDNYQLPLEMFRFTSPQKSEDEMYLWELRRNLAAKARGTVEYNRGVIELQRRFSLPLGTLVLILIAMPLGISTRVEGRSLTLIAGLSIFLLYYLLLTAAWRLGRQGLIPPELAPWLPDLVFSLVAAVGWRRVWQDRSLIGW